MRVVYEPAAVRALARMPERDRDTIRRKLASYAATGVGDVSKLSGRDLWRLRHGDWRAIFAVEGEVIVVRIAHRREVYR